MKNGLLPEQNQELPDVYKRQAVATVTAQITVSFIFILAVRKEEVLFGSFRLFTVTPVRYIKEIVTIGFPASIQNLIYASISMVLTRLVTGWGDTAVAIQRVGGQVESVSWMVGEGFAAAVNSFTGQNFGAGLFLSLIHISSGFIRTPPIIAAAAAMNRLKDRRIVYQYLCIAFSP